MFKNPDSDLIEIVCYGCFRLCLADWAYVIKSNNLLYIRDAYTLPPCCSIVESYNVPILNNLQIGVTGT